MSWEDKCSFEENGRIVVPWECDNGMLLDLLTPAEYEALPIGTRLGSISGDIKEKTGTSHVSGDRNYIDDDTRMGRLAYGTIYRDPQPRSRRVEPKLDWGIRSIVEGTDTERIIDCKDEAEARDWVERFPKSYKAISRISAGRWFDA